MVGFLIQRLHQASRLWLFALSCLMFWLLTSWLQRRWCIFRHRNWVISRRKQTDGIIKKVSLAAPSADLYLHLTSQTMLHGYLQPKDFKNWANRFLPYLKADQLVYRRSKAPGTENKGLDCAQHSGQRELDVSMTAPDPTHSESHKGNVEAAPG